MEVGWECQGKVFCWKCHFLLKISELAVNPQGDLQPAPDNSPLRFFNLQLDLFPRSR
jgi:hypothetical protein